jgi:D-glycero-D-manno-heptose 1,7-bisphosphate phosphatase
VKIEYVVETEPLGTAGALFLLKEKLGEDFLLLCGDVIFDIDVKRFYDFHKARGGVATLFTHPNSHPYDSGIIMADDAGKVTNWLHKEDPRTWYRNRVNAGLHFFSHEIFEQGLFQELKKVDLDREVLKPLIPTGQLFVYDSPEYVKDMGTPDRLEAVRSDYDAGRLQRGSLTHRQKAVSLDRDGTINEYVGFLRRTEEMTLLPGAAEAIRRIHDAGYLAIVVTNQPVIARGDVSFDGLDEIHRKMETMLGLEGAYIDDLFLCPHHPDKGFPGERAEYKIPCDCRKPRPGMLLAAAEKYNIDLAQSWMIGDSGRDVQAGQAAGCRTALIGEGEYGQDATCASLLEFARSLT